MNLEELRARRRKMFEPTQVPKGLLFAPLLLLGVIAIGYVLFKSADGFDPQSILFAVAPPTPTDDGTVRFIPPEVTTAAAVPDDAPSANVTADIVITTDAVLLDGQKIAVIVNGELKPEELTEDGLLKPLFDKLKHLGVPPTPVPIPWRLAAHVSADRGTQYRVLKSIGDTAQKAGFRDLGFETLAPAEEVK